MKKKKWNNLTNFEIGVLKNSLEMDFHTLKIHYGGKLGKSHYIKFIKALETIEQQGLLFLERDSCNGWIQNHQYLEKLLKIKNTIVITEEKSSSKNNFNSVTNELKLKLTINKEKYHPDSPLYSGIVTFKEKIILNPNIEYIFAQWERANNNLYFTLVPISQLEKLPTQKHIAKLPITLKKGIEDFFINLSKNNRY